MIGKSKHLINISAPSKDKWLRIFALISVVISNGILFAPVLAGSTSQANASNQAENQATQATSVLHRLDFRLEGKSCAACLLSIQRKLNSLPGVKNAVVMLKRPYGVSIVYDGHDIKSDEILSLLKDKEPNIKILEINDASINTVPPLLIPPFVPQSEN